MDKQHHQLESSILAYWPIAKWSNMTIVVACSGGADSTALLCALARVKHDTTTLKVAHFNHQLRGKDSDADELFVIELAERLNCIWHVERADEFQKRSQVELMLGTSEDNLRNVRYEFLQAYANQVGARYIVTAHTADDQAETILHRLCRGSGLQGLAGIPRFRSTDDELIVARPMLSIWRTQVVDYLKAIGQSFRLDLSNEGLLYTRNRIRNEILPQLEVLVHPKSKQNLVDTGELISELLEYFQTQASGFLDEHVKFLPGKVQIDLHQFTAIGEALGKEALRSIWNRMRWPMKDMAREHWEKLYASIVDNQGLSPHNQTDFPGRIRLSKGLGDIIIQRF